MTIDLSTRSAAVIPLWKELHKSQEGAWIEPREVKDRLFDSSGGGSFEKRRALFSTIGNASTILLENGLLEREDRCWRLTKRGRSISETDLKELLPSAVYRQSPSPKIVSDSNEDDATVRWIRSTLTFASDAAISKRALYAAYQKAMGVKGESPLSQHLFVPVLREETTRASAVLGETKRVIDGKRQNAWKGIRILDGLERLGSQSNDDDLSDLPAKRGWSKRDKERFWKPRHNSMRIAVFRAIRSLGVPVSCKKIGEHLGIEPKAAYKVIMSCEKDGFLAQKDRTAEGVLFELTDRGHGLPRPTALPRPIAVPTRKTDSNTHSLLPALIEELIRATSPILDRFLKEAAGGEDPKRLLERALASLDSGRKGT